MNRFINIKFNENNKWFKLIPKILKSKSPIYNKESLSKIQRVKVHSIWKSTKKNRFLIADRYAEEVINMLPGKCEFLEVAASDGSSCIQLYQKVYKKIHRFYITDLFLKVYYRKNLLFNYLTLINETKPFMAWNKYLVIYSDQKSMWIVLNWISKFIKIITYRFCITKSKKIFLVNKSVLKLRSLHKKIKIFNIGACDDFPSKNINLVRAMNLFNREYFSDNQIIEMVKHLQKNIDNGGYLILGENRQTENVALYQKIDNKIRCIKHTSELPFVHHLVENLSFNVSTPK